MSRATKPNPKWAEMLRVEGINCKGYGNVPKYAMRDPDLSITAKGIYAYFCAMSGSGDSSYPSAETVQNHLLLGNQAYYNHRKPLVEQGYITIEAKGRPGGGFSVNVFTIVANPKKFADASAENEWQEKTYNTIEHAGLKAAGYGEIARTVMQDPRMDITAKAVYAYFASYAGSGQTAFPQVSQILRDLGVAKATYQKAMKTLQNLGYIIVKQVNWEKGVSKGFGCNRYILATNPVEILSQPKKPSTVKPSTAKSKTVQASTAEPQTVDSRTVEPQTMNPQTTNNSRKTKNIVFSNNIHPSINTPPPPAGLMDGWDTPEETDYESIIKENVQYDILPQLVEYPDVDKAKELVLLMITACESTSENIRIGGEAIPIEKVRKRLLSLNAEHIKYVIESVRPYESSIRNVRAYNLAALYHAAETMESYYSSYNP